MGRLSNHDGDSNRELWKQLLVLGAKQHWAFRVDQFFWNISLKSTHPHYYDEKLSNTCLK